MFYAYVVWIFVCNCMGLQTYEAIVTDIYDFDKTNLGWDGCERDSWSGLEEANTVWLAINTKTGNEL